MCNSIVSTKITLIALITIGVIINGVDAHRPRRTIGGEDAAPNEFPWMARLNVTHNNGVNYECGGVIISPRHVLTAGHCLDSVTVNSVWTGFHIRDSNIAVKSNAAQIIVHTQYKLDGDLKLGANQAIIPLANNETTVGTRGTLPGWGLTDEWMTHRAIILQKSSIDIQPGDQCVVQRSELLCGRSPPHATPCDGDSGSGLVVDGRVVGITSSSFCIPGRETMFTSVYHHLAWIKSNIEKSSV